MSKTYVVGLMSGTSVDGIDAAVIEIDSTSAQEVSVQLLAFENTPFPKETRDRIFELLILRLQR